MSDLQVTLGQLNGDGHHLIAYRFGDACFPDKVDMASAFQREESLKRAMRHFGVGSKSLTDLSQQLAALAAQAEQAQDGEKTQPQLPQIEDACDFCTTELPLPEELIQGVLHRGSKLSLGGASKGFKTWTLMYLALCVAYGLPWLGCSTVAAKVLVVNLEIQAAFARRRLKVLAETLGITQEQNRLDVWNLRGYATCHREIFPKIIDRIGNGGYGLIVLDPIYKLYGATDNENGARDVAALMNSIEVLAVKTGAAVAFGAHYSKGNQAAKDAIDRVSGSGVFARDPDSLLNFTSHKESDCYTVEATLRNFPPLDPFVVRWGYPLFAREASLNPAELKRPNKGRGDKAAEMERKETEQRSRLLKALQTAPDGDTAKGLRITAGLNAADFGKAILTLLQEGCAERCRIKKHTRIEDGYKPTGK